MRGNWSLACHNSQHMNEVMRVTDKNVNREPTANAIPSTEAQDTSLSGENLSPAALAQRYGDDWLARHLADVVEYFSSRQQLHTYFDYWQAREFHITLNHFYEPVPDTRQLTGLVWERPSQLPGIAMNDAGQLALLHQHFSRFRQEYDAFPHAKPAQPAQFHFDNPTFSGTDALVLYCMVRYFKPNRVVEVGSGMSTRLSAHAALLNGNTEVVAIEPYPDPVLQQGFPGLSTLIVKPIQTVDLSFFEQLQAQDILFIDTTHVVRTGSDVNFLFLEVLPRLNSGVIVHIHDIFLPYDYPRAWVIDQHRFWNEQYLAQAFLIYNSAFDVLFANNYMWTKHPADMQAAFPFSPWWGGGSLWIQRKA